MPSRGCTQPLDESQLVGHVPCTPVVMKKTRTTPDAEMDSGLNSMTISGTGDLRSVEEGIVTVNSGIWEIFHEHPNVGGH